jgi:tetratricopeptide (TPR) repeat protein
LNLDHLHDGWPELSALLDEALGLTEAERSAWLASLPADKSMHRETLARLLATGPGMETDALLATLPRFDPPPLDGEADPLAQATPGDLVGPYRLLSEIGRGGMGAVWLAERADAQPRRQVALKLPHIGWAPGLITRLARERDILASLEHPHIARLYDAGVDQLGRPYLALEYVAGLPIDRYCEQHDLSLRQRLALVLQVAAAVAHAHTRLVVHRDLKPSNILVTEAGEVRLLDFGIAKLLQEDGGEAGELTRISGRALTPDYASPEQIQGLAIGTASDVYSLGVVAYELLAGTRPYRLKGAGAGGLAEAIAEAEKPPASRATADPALRRQLTGDIDAILNKALKKDPSERYATVTAFADDIERHLHHQPVAARPDRLGYRTRKFIARHALQVSAGALVLVALLAGSGVALWQARQARFEAARAEQVKDFALSIFENADTDSGAGAATTAADLLVAAESRIERELAGRPETAVELMTAIGYSLLGQGRTEDAGKILRKAVDLAGRELGPRHPRALAATVVYGEALVGLDKPKEAIALLTPAVAEARRQGATHVLIDALRWLGSAKLDVGDVDGGIASERAAVDALDSPGGASKRDAMSAWASLANGLVFAQRPGAVDAARRALALTKELQGDGVNEPMLTARALLAQGLTYEGHDQAALDELSSVLADTVRFLGPNHPKAEMNANFLGAARLEAGDAAGAVEAFQIALTASRRATVENPAMRQGVEHYSLASALAAARRREEALPHVETAVRMITEAGGADAPLALRARSAHALMLTRLGRLDESDRAFAALATAPFAGPDKATHALRQATLRSLQGRHDEAIALARPAVDALASYPSKIVRATANSTLGIVLLAAGRATDALPPLREAVRLYAEKQLVMSADRADAIAALGRAEGLVQHAAADPKR